jgi:hypothetical protein
MAELVGQAGRIAHEPADEVVEDPDPEYSQKKGRAELFERRYGAA